MNEFAQFIDYLQSEQESRLNQADALTADHRLDEANMAKIRANVFGIFATVSQKVGVSLIQEQIETIPEAWRESLSAAERYGDHTKAMIERIKLEAIAEIGETYARLMEGSIHGR